MPDGGADRHGMALYHGFAAVFGLRDYSAERDPFVSAVTKRRRADGNVDASP